MTKVSTHPDRRLPEHKQALARVRQEVNADLRKLEEWKPELKRRHERYQESLRRIEANRGQERKQNYAASLSSKSSGRQSLDGAAMADDEARGVSRLVNAGEHSDLALRLAQREQKRRIVTRRTGEDGQALRETQDELDDLAKGIREIGQRLGSRPEASVGTSKQQTDVYTYPKVDSHRDTPSAGNIMAYKSRQAVPELPPKQIHAPRVPPKQQQDWANLPPTLPAKSILGAPHVSEAASTAPAIPSKEDVSSSDYTFKPSAVSESGAPLRTLFLPTELRTGFLAIAASNTRNKLETCGILCGTLISNALFVSHLVIPDQTSTSDTCDTTEQGDSALFDYVDNEELMVCGWIHTHPTQTCFLSSRDLHTSVGYQVMLPESVAIVCAPTQNPDHGIFRLTDPPGKQAILNCHQSGLFHPHAQTNLYTDATRPGHVSELQGLQFHLIDLRKG